MDNPIDQAALAAGGITKLAAALGESVQAVTNWRVRRAPSDRCPNIEQATAGRVTCESLRPDVRWARVPDPSWPHPEGRPCIDVAAPVEARAA